MLKSILKFGELLDTRNAELDLEIKAGIAEIKRQAIEFKGILLEDIKSLFKGN